MNVLVVDDDVLAVQGIISAIQREKLGIEQIFCAYRVQEAKEILQKEKVDIALCDIEMPRGNGLELMEWIRREGYMVIMMILTSHADFHYATQAIKVGSFDYLLKPVTDEELNTALEKAIEKQRENKHLVQESKNWKKRHKMLEERFWTEVMLGIVEGDWKRLNEYAKQKTISLEENMEYLPILFCIKKYPESLKECDRGSVQFIMKNIGYELFEKTAQRVGCADVQERGIVVLLYGTWEDEKVRKSCEAYLLAFQDYFQCGISGYRGKSVKIEDLAKEVQILQNAEKNNVTWENQIWQREDDDDRKKEYDPFDYNEVIRLTQGQQIGQAVYQIKSYLKKEQEQKKLDGILLAKMQNDLLQAVYVVLKEAGIQAHLLFEDQESKNITSSALLTLEDFEKWIFHILDKTGNVIQFAKSDSSVVGQAEQYIRQNLDKVMGCDDVAREVCMNSDYLSRLFKKETGMPLQKYINQKRVEKAQDLLSATDISVSTIAQMVGYSHFSHFSTSFKKATQMSPMDYRKKYRKKEEERYEENA
ncbi:MAG: response regulator [Lachnospiraceae bacterium]|nr:response regulator [Robinsoniella sp.]MDY3767779.1 response regulator [Lachnospiraceae bacterium]